MAIAALTLKTQLITEKLVRSSLEIPAFPFARIGKGEVHAHHGEIMQGLFYSTERTLEHALVTLPCQIFRTRARYQPTRSGPLIIEPRDRLRALIAARLTLEAVGYKGWGGYVCLTSNVPLCWGCGSSTTDVVATIRAVADAFSIVLERESIARLAVVAETASDPLMYGHEKAVLFAQRRGSVLCELDGPLPPVRILGFNTAEECKVETLRLSPISYSSWEVQAFRPMLGLLKRAVAQQDASLLGRVATASTVITQRHRPKRYMPELLRLAQECSALGIQVAHSGTVVGYIFECQAPVAQLEQARDGLKRLSLRSWEFITGNTSFTPPLQLGSLGDELSNR